MKLLAFVPLDILLRSVIIFYFGTERRCKRREPLTFHLIYFIGYYSKNNIAFRQDFFARNNVILIHWNLTMINCHVVITPNEQSIRMWNILFC